MCKICGNKSTNIHIGKKIYGLCPSCGYLEKPDNEILSEEKEYERYLLHDNNDNSDYVSYQTKFFAEIKDYLGQNTLDFGCGNHHILANILNENNYHCDYYDYYFYNEEKDSTYDSIILEEVIEHLSDPMGVIDQILTKLNPNGTIIISTMFIPENLENWWYLRDTTHIGFFSKKTFLKIKELKDLDTIFLNEKNLVILRKKK